MHFLFHLTLNNVIYFHVIISVDLFEDGIWDNERWCIFFFLFHLIVSNICTCSNSWSYFLTLIITIWYFNVCINFLFENFISFKSNRNSKKYLGIKKKLNIIHLLIMSEAIINLNPHNFSTEHGTRLKTTGI